MIRRKFRVGGGHDLTDPEKLNKTPGEVASILPVRVRLRGVPGSF
ncbi:hypothetical protein Brsp02_00734 [Brucella sp. NBRC 113783]